LLFAAGIPGRRRLEASEADLIVTAIAVDDPTMAPSRA
jgi:hypothetical protein